MNVRSADVRHWVMSAIHEGLDNWHIAGRGETKLYYSKERNDFYIVNHETSAYDDCILLVTQPWYDVMHDEEYRDWYNPREHEWDTWEEMEQEAPDEFEDLVDNWREQAIYNKLYEVKVDHLLDIMDDIETKLANEGIELSYE